MLDLETKTKQPEQPEQPCIRSSSPRPGSSSTSDEEPADIANDFSETLQKHVEVLEQDTVPRSTSFALRQGSMGRLPKGQLVFDADFEGANFGGVKPLEDGVEYDIQIRPDLLSSRHRLWFHFRVRNCLAGQQVLFSITNFSKTRSLFRHGMAPVVRSTSRPAWHRVPTRNTYYYRTSGKSKGSYALSFAFQFDRELDTYEFAYSIPYTYTDLQRDLTWMDCMAMPYYRRQLLCRTPHLRRTDLITISEPMLPEPGEVSSNKHTHHRRRVVAISARVHPGETPASHFIQGLMSFLMSGDPDAVMLRTSITWVIVPMLNPDGVFLGNYRTDSGGTDLNRAWATCSPQGEPSVHHSLEVLQRYYNDPAYNLEVFVDVHGHSNSRASFMFCNPPRELDIPANVERITRLPRLLDARMPGFSLAACSFDEDASKAGCARRVAGVLLPETLCYTLEISFFCVSGEAPGISVAVSAPESPAPVAFTNTVEGYHEMARQFALAFLCMGPHAQAALHPQGHAAPHDALPKQLPRLSLQ